MKIMAKDSSASTRVHTPHVNPTTRTATIIDALKRRAQAVLNDDSLDPQSRAIIRYGLETNDPWLAKLVRQAEASESGGDTRDYRKHLNLKHPLLKHSNPTQAIQVERR